MLKRFFLKNKVPKNHIPDHCLFFWSPKEYTFLLLILRRLSLRRLPLRLIRRPTRRAHLLDHLHPRREQLDLGREDGGLAARHRLRREDLDLR